MTIKCFKILFILWIVDLAQYAVLSYLTHHGGFDDFVIYEAVFGFPLFILSIISIFICIIIDIFR